MTENRTFTTFDSFSVLSLLIFVIILVGTIISSAMINQRETQVRKKASQLGLHILLGGQLVSEENVDSKTKDRRIASEVATDDSDLGRAGSDPWGNAYYYKIRSNVANRKSIVIVSSGPDGMLDKKTEEMAFADNKYNVAPKPNLSGDDIGIVEWSE
jgi:hypothetical protein